MMYLMKFIICLLWIFPFVFLLIYTYIKRVDVEKWIWFELFMFFSLIPIFNWFFLYYFWKVLK